ncbi:MAG: hypothetical protein DRO62_00340 [Candidatus Altiarchaeales archaeon]|nr:MAG: hypothetical protein DRO62_00340 [Candidatus Altiarchaeales archaeon]
MNTDRMIIILISIGILYLVITSVVDVSTIFKKRENVTEPTVLGIKSDQIGNYYIYMYDILTKETTTIASNKAGLFNPFIYKNKVVYTSYQNGNGDIYLYNIDSGETKEITSNPYNQDLARIYGDIIVWDDSRSEYEKGSRVTNKQDIYMYDLNKGVESAVIKTGLPDRFPDIYGDIIVAEIYLRGIYGNVYIYNITSGELKGVTSNPTGHEHIRIYKNKIVWYTQSPCDIHMYDLSTGETMRLTNVSGCEIYPNIHENVVVYQRTLSGNNSDIYAYDLNTKREIQITNTPEFSETLPDIYDDKIAFVRMYSPDKMDIFVYDLNTGREIKIRSPSDFNHGPEIYGDKVVWTAFDVSK